MATNTKHLLVTWKSAGLWSKVGLWLHLNDNLLNHYFQKGCASVLINYALLEKRFHARNVENVDFHDFQG